MASLAGPGPTVTLDRRSGVAGVPLTRGRAVAGPELSRRACEEHPFRWYARASEASERETLPKESLEGFGDPSPIALSKESRPRRSQAAKHACFVGFQRAKPFGKLDAEQSNLCLHTISSKSDRRSRSRSPSEARGKFFPNFLYFYIEKC